MAKEREKKKMGLLGPWSGLGHGSSCPDDEREPARDVIRTAREKRHIRRIVKRGPMFRRHLSEALEAPEIKDADIEVTRSVIEKVETSASPAPKASKPPLFKCFQCGTSVPVGAERCPVCHVLYVDGISDEDIRALEEAQSDQDTEMDYVSLRELDEESSLLHFDPVSGVIVAVENENGTPGFGIECSNCGTVIEFITEACPICGASLECENKDLIGLISNMEVDPGCAGEIDCPACGERIVPKDGVCQSCGEKVHEDGFRDAAMKVIPIVRWSGIVFVHLDVATGELNCLQRQANRQGYERISIQLESIGKGDFEQFGEWKGLSRI